MQSAKKNLTRYGALTASATHIKGCVDTDQLQWGWAKNDGDFETLVRVMDSLAAAAVAQPALGKALSLDFPKLKVKLKEDYNNAITGLHGITAVLDELDTCTKQLIRCHEVKTTRGADDETPKAKKQKKQS